MEIPDDFVFPKAYLNVEKKGFMDASTFLTRDEISRQSFVWFNDMEFLSSEQIDSFIPHDGQKQQIIPFAKDTSISLWAWLYTPGTQDYPVIFCPSDDYNGFMYAPSFEVAIVRHIFEFASQNNFCLSSGEEWEMPVALARLHIKNWIDKLMIGFPKVWRDEVETLTTKELIPVYTQTKEPRFDYLALMTPEEALAKTKQLFGYEALDSEVQWCDELSD